MKITVIPSDGTVGVDGAFRNVSMAGIDPTIHAVQFDTAKNNGSIEFKADLAVRPDNQTINSIALFQVFLDRWTAAAPVAVPLTSAQLAEQARLQSLNAAISADTTIQSIKAMTASQFDIFWDANVTSAAQAIGILKKLVKVILRQI